MPPVVGLLAALLVTLACCGLGRLLLGRWLPKELPVELRMAAFGWVGLTTLAYAVLAAGLRRDLGTASWALTVVLIALAIIGLALPLPAHRSALAAIVRWLRAANRSAWPTVLWCLAGISIVFAAAGSLSPPGTNEWDSLTYHLAAPKLYAQSDSIHRIFWDHHTNSPFNLEMLYTLGLLFGSESMAKGFHFAVYLLLIASVHGAARHWVGERAGTVPALASTIVATLPPIAWEAATAYIDLGAALGEWLALIWLIEWGKRDIRDVRGLALAGVFAGTALATKVLGGMVLAFAVVAVAVRCLRERRLALPGGLAMVALALLVSGPWFLRSWIWTGNPIYPYAYSVFGGADWDEECASNYRADQKTYGFGHVARDAATGSWRPSQFLPPSSPVKPPMGPATRAVNALFAKGVPNPVLGIPLVPLFLTFDGATFWERPMAIGLLGPIFLAFLPALLLLRPLPAWVRVLLGFALFTLATWWFTTQLTRYLIPMLVALAVPTALAVETLGGEERRLARIARFLAASSLAVGVCVSILYGQTPLAFALGRVSREEAIEASFENWDLIKAANADAGPDGHVALYGEPRGYYLSVRYLWADAGYHTRLPYSRMAGPEELLAAWSKLGVTHVLINRTYARATYEGTDAPGRLIAELRTQGRLAVVAETKQGVLLYIDRPSSNGG